jgi:predicted RNA-binding Zn-ribbon protein involved in translation (DUF1610 family)
MDVREAVDEFMGNVARYLIPIDSKLSAAEYGKKAKAALLQMGVIFKAEDTPEEGIFHNGDKSRDPFQTEPGDDEYGFESALIFSSLRFILGPDEYVDGVSCPKCNADIIERWIEEVRDDDGKRVEHDSRDVRIACPNCGAVLRIDEVKGETVDKFYMTDRYVSFWNARPFKPEWVAEFDRQMGCRHETFDYGWT